MPKKFLTDDDVYAYGGINWVSSTMNYSGVNRQLVPKFIVNNFADITQLFKKIYQNDSIK